MFIPERLDELMAARNITAYKISKAIGCSNSSIANWRNGSVSPDSENIRKLSEFFGVSITYFFKEKPTAQEDGRPVDEIALEYSIRFKNLSPQNQERALHYLGMLENQDSDQSP